MDLCERCHGLVHGKGMTISVLTKAALASKASRGEYVGGFAPYGSTLVEGTLVALPDEQGVIVEARALRAAGLSLRAVAETLAERGITSRSGRPFAPSAIASMTATLSLVQVPAEQAVITEVRACRDAGMSLRAITALLAERGRTGRTGKSLSVTQIRNILVRSTRRPT